MHGAGPPSHPHFRQVQSSDLVEEWVTASDVLAYSPSPPFDRVERSINRHVPNGGQTSKGLQADS